MKERDSCFLRAEASCPSLIRASRRVQESQLNLTSFLTVHTRILQTQTQKCTHSAIFPFKTCVQSYTRGANSLNIHTISVHRNLLVRLLSCRKHCEQYSNQFFSRIISVILESLNIMAKIMLFLNNLPVIHWLGQTDSPAPHSRRWLSQCCYVRQVRMLNVLTIDKYIYTDASLAVSKGCNCVVEL